MYTAVYWIVLIVIMGGAWYFLIMRPQRRRAKEREMLLSEIKPGERVITAAGIYGEVSDIAEDTVIIKLEDGARMRIARASIERVLREEITE